MTCSVRMWRVPSVNPETKRRAALAKRLRRKLEYFQRIPPRRLLRELDEPFTSKLSELPYEGPHRANCPIGQHGLPANCQPLLLGTAGHQRSILPDAATLPTRATRAVYTYLCSSVWQVSTPFRSSNADGVIPGSCRSCPKNANGAPHPCRSDHEREASTMRWSTVSI